jgi:hypothetical protein
MGNRPSGGLVLTLVALAAVLLLGVGCGEDTPAGGCGPANCSGCCHEGSCVQPPTDKMCGAAGFPCTDCTLMGQTCSAKGLCEGGGACGPESCTGCCQGNTCIESLTDATCGTGGAACVDCTATGQTCDVGTGTCQGTASCGPGTCVGCCQGDTCVQSLTDGACGTGGAACVDCTATGQTCDVSAGTCQGTPSCGPASCSGCCQGNSCIQPPTDAACGTGGEPCQACASNEKCSGGQCLPQGTASYAVILKSASLLVSPWVACVEANCDMYVELTVGKVIATSSTISNNNSPVWNEQLTISPKSEITAGFEVEVWDDDIGPDLLPFGKCSATVSAADLNAGAITLTCSDLVDTCEVTFGFVPQ